MGIASGNKIKDGVSFCALGRKREEFAVSRKDPMAQICSCGIVACLENSVITTLVGTSYIIIEDML
jgi:hypothetical protein